MKNIVLAFCFVSTFARVYSSDRIYFESDFDSAEVAKMSLATTTLRPTVPADPITELSLRQPLPTIPQPPSPQYQPPTPVPQLQPPPPQFLPEMSPEQHTIPLPPYTPGPLARGINALTLNLETLLDTEKNYIVFSPLSVAAALSLVLLGAGGQTMTELATFLGLNAGVNFESDGTDKVHGDIANYFSHYHTGAPGTARFANGVFIQHDLPVSNLYLNNVRKYYGEEVNAVNFRQQGQFDATNYINHWAANRTDGHVAQVINTPLPAETTAVFINVIYFEGEWKTPFCTMCVKWGNFYVSPTETVRVQLMPNVGDAYFLEDKSRGYKLLGLPYKNPDVAMYFILPTTNEVKKFLSGITVDDIHNMIGNATYQETIYVVPKMKLESTIDLIVPLKKMGLKSLFTPSADLRGIASGIWIDAVLQKVNIEITETGTKAVVSTMISSTRGGHRPTVRLDKPFIFVVYDRSLRTITFWGTVYKPTPYDDKSSHRPALGNVH